jgi:hypothetical protein
MEHTPTPWELDDTHFLHALNQNMVVVPLVDYDHAKNCVNACAEFPDPAKEIQAMQDRVKELEGERQWISVTDELPDDNMEVNCVINGLYGTAIYNGGKQIFENETYDDFASDLVTHWLPIPKYPINK